MKFNFAKKKKIVEKTKKIATKSLSVITANISGIKTNKLNNLRKKARDKNVKIQISRNTLLKKSFLKTDYALLIPKIKGPILVAFSMKHPGSASRLFLEFKKKNKKFKIINAVFENKILFDQEINALASMPTKKEAFQKILIILQNASIKKLMSILVQIKIKLQNKK